jgi:hypothetical protein
MKAVILAVAASLAATLASAYADPVELQWRRAGGGATVAKNAAASTAAPQDACSAGRGG